MATALGQGEFSPHPDKPLVYFSAAILARRRRLLKETRRMISEDGIDGFSVRKLCQKAGVSQRTLYNAFQSKDRLIAFAIREAFEEFQSYAHSGVNLKGSALADLILGTLATNRRNLRVRNYTRAVCTLYFSPKTPRDVWETLQNMSLSGTGAWLRRRQDDFHPWIDLGHLAHLLADVQYATIHDWCLERICDADYLPRLAENMLVLVAGAARGELAEEAQEYLKMLRETGDVEQLMARIGSPEPATAPRRRSAARKAAN